MVDVVDITKVSEVEASHVGAQEPYGHHLQNGSRVRKVAGAVLVALTEGEILTVLIASAVGPELAAVLVPVMLPVLAITFFFQALSHGVDWREINEEIKNLWEPRELDTGGNATARHLRALSEVDSTMSIKLYRTLDSQTLEIALKLLVTGSTGGAAARLLPTAAVPISLQAILPAIAAKRIYWGLQTEDKAQVLSGVLNALTSVAFMAAVNADSRIGYGVTAFMVALGVIPIARYELGASAPKALQYGVDRVAEIAYSGASGVTEACSRLADAVRQCLQGSSSSLSSVRVEEVQQSPHQVP